MLPAINQAPPVQAAITTTWTKDTTNNPVFTKANKAAGACVIYDEDAQKYKMWYTRISTNFTSYDNFFDDIWALDLGTLNEDIRNRRFTHIADNNSQALKNIIDYLAEMSVDELETVLLGTRSSIGYATSLNGITWQDHGTVLQTTSGQWDKYYVGAPSVIRNSASDYEMWYTGGQVDVSKVATVLDDLTSLSADNISFILGEFTHFNIPGFIDNLVAAPGSLFKLVADIIYAIDSTDIAIGYATSSNGISWDKYHDNPVLQETADAWDRYGVGTPSVVKSDGSYQMWYSGFEIDYAELVALLNAASLADVVDTSLSSIKVRIGYATSGDGTGWTKYANNPVLYGGSADAWDEFGVGTPSVIKNDSNYEMWYTGAKIDGSVLNDFLRDRINTENSVITGIDFAIGHATSTNGYSWTRVAGNPVISKGSGQV